MSRIEQFTYSICHYFSFTKCSNISVSWCDFTKFWWTISQKISVDIQCTVESDEIYLLFRFYVKSIPANSRVSKTGILTSLLALIFPHAHYDFPWNQLQYFRIPTLWCDKFFFYFRLKKTWGLLSRRDKQCFDKLFELFSDDSNFEKLRKHLDFLALTSKDCIPYLGLYLTDLIHIDMAHPYTGGLETNQRMIKMNNILRIISELQRSNYEYLIKNEECHSYLRSLRYIGMYLLKKQCGNCRIFLLFIFYVKSILEKTSKTAILAVCRTSDYVDLVYFNFQKVQKFIKNQI